MNRPLASHLTVRRLLITATIIVAVIVVVIACASPVGKYIIESYVGPTILGRQVKTSWVYVNPFTGYVHISGLKIYEPGGDSLTILKADELNVHYNIPKTLTKTFEFTDADLVRPVGWIIQDHKVFNFTDLIIHFSPKHPHPPGPKVRHPLHINVLHFKITDGEFHYIEKSIPINYYMKHVNISSTGKWWDIDSFHLKFDMQSGSGTGTVRGEGYLDLYKLDYGVSVSMRHLDLQILEQYLRDLANYASLRGTIDADINSTGNFKDKLALHADGPVSVHDFHVGKSPTSDIVAFERLSFSIHDLTPRRYQYWFDSIALQQPYFVYERYDYLDNLRNMFGAKAQKVKAAQADNTKFNLILEIGKYVKVLVKNFLQSSYRLNHFDIYDGDLKYIDYALREKFYIGAKHLYTHADSVYKDNPHIQVSIKTDINPHGTFTASVGINPGTYQDYDLHYQLSRLPAALFNPYFVTYTSYPVDRGIIELGGATTVRSDILHSDNHLLILDTRVAGRMRKGDTKYEPMPLIIALLRNPGNAVDVNLPIAGNLHDPHFKIWNIVGQIVRNIIIKPPYTAYIEHTKKVENTVEKNLAIKWELRRCDLLEDQEKHLQQIADFMQRYPQAQIQVTSYEYVAKEKEYILLYEAKKRYYLDSRHQKATAFTMDDSLAVDHMSVKDSGFVHYLTVQPGVALLYSVQEKAAHLLGQQLVDERYAQLCTARREKFLSYFRRDGTADRVHFTRSHDIIPFDGYSVYKIEYKGKTPPELIEAYDKLVALNHIDPRLRYAAKRRALAGMLIDEKKLKQNDTPAQSKGK